MAYNQSDALFEQSTDTNGNFAGTYANSARTGIANNPIADLSRGSDDYNKNTKVIDSSNANCCDASDS